jgi:hypothetical protein
MKDKQKKIEKMELGELSRFWNELAYSIEERLHETEAHHSAIKEDELFDVLQEIQDKINEIIAHLNQEGEEK